MTNKRAKKATKTLLAKDPQYFSKIGKKSAESEKHNTFTSKAARRAAWLRWHPNDPLPDDLK